MGTLITVTDAGRAALVAPGNDGTNAHKVAEIGLATAPFVARKGLKKLPNELKRITTFGGANVAPDTIHATLQDNTADQYTLYGFGLYLEDGTLVAAYGQSTPIMEKSPLAALLLSTDIQFATIDAARLVFGDTSFINPPATTEQQGVVELATLDEAQDGEDDVRAVTPAGLRKFGVQFGGVTALNVDIDLKKTHAGRAIQWFGPDGGRLRLPAGTTLKDGTAFYVYNHGAGVLNLGLQSTEDSFWTAARSTQLTLQRGDSAFVVARGTNQFDLCGGSLATRFLSRLILGGRLLVGTDADDGQSAVQVAGNVRVSGGGAVSVDGGAKQYRINLYSTAGKVRWIQGVDDADETGGNAGSNWFINRYDDTGKHLDTPFFINRASGLASFAQRPSWAGATPWDTGNFSPASYLPLSGGALYGQLGLLSGNQILFQSRDGKYSAFLRADDAAMVGFLNNAQNAWNMQVYDSGYISFPRARPGWLGLTPWDNGNLPNPVRNPFSPNTIQLDWGAHVSGQVGLTVDTSWMGYLLHSGNFGSRAGNAQWQFTPAANSRYDRSLYFVAPCNGYVVASQNINVSNGGTSNLATIGQSVNVNGAGNEGDSTQGPQLNTSVVWVGAGTGCTINGMMATGPGATVPIAQCLQYIFIPVP